MQMAEARSSGGHTGLRDPFAWREALTPPGGVSPASTARSSRGGCSFRSGGSGCSNAPTPNSGGTPPESPHPLNLSARSGGSNASSRSGRGYGYGPMAAPLHGMPHPNAEQSRSWSSGSGAGSGRTGSFVTPNSSARMSEFGSVYDSQSHCGSGSARTADLGSVRENAYTADRGGYLETPEMHKPSRKKHNRASAVAAFDAFAPPAERKGVSLPSGALEPEEAEVSLDPRIVFSAARHGRHKEVEASLAAGFDPDYADSFGNTLFHVACQNGNKRVAKLAIKYGGNMDAQNLKGNTGVHFLFAYGYQDVGEYFIDKGASDELPNDVGKTARQGIR